MTEPSDQNPSPDPEAAGAAPPSPVGWAAWTPPEPGTPDPPRRMAVRIVEGVAWTVGILAVLFLGRAFVLFRPDGSLSSFQQGEIIGRMVGAVLAGVVIRWIWVKLRKRGSVRSPWVLLVAVIGLGFGIASTPGVLPVPAPTPIGTYLKVGAPYVIEAAPPDVAAGIVDSLSAAATQVEVRQISIGGESVAYLVVANINADGSEAYMRGVEGGFKESSGGEAHRDVIGGKAAVVGTAENGGLVAWTEPPYSVTVYAADAGTIKEIAASVIAAYQ